MMKPKQAQAEIPNQSSTRDRCQTPPYALNPLLPYLPKPPVRVWEPAAGEGLLAAALREHGYTVTESDILTGQNFFDATPKNLDLQITNPPYSIKYKWWRRSYQIGLPFALLVPAETIFNKTAFGLWFRHGFEVIAMDDRVDFKMPEKGWGGVGSQFPVIWLTYGLNIGSPLAYASLCKPSRQRRAEMALGFEQLALFGGA